MITMGICLAVSIVCIIVLSLILYVTIQEVKDLKSEIRSAINIGNTLKVISSNTIDQGLNLGAIRDSVNDWENAWEVKYKELAEHVEQNLIKNNNLMTRIHIEQRKATNKSVFDRKENEDEQTDSD